MEEFLFLPVPNNWEESDSRVWLRPPAVSSQARTVGRDLLQWAFSFKIKHPQEGEMKDKSRKRAETEGNEIIADLLCSRFVCKIITSVGVYVCCCNKICLLKSPNLTSGWYFITCCVQGRLLVCMCMCVQSGNVTKHNTHSLVKTQRVVHTLALW